MRIATGPVVVGLTVLVALLASSAGAASPPAMVDLTKAVVVASKSADSVELQAVNLLRWEVQHRIGNYSWGLTPDGKPTDALPAGDVPAILVGSLERMPALPQGTRIPHPVMKQGKPAAEGYVLRVDTKSRPAPTVYAIGSDHRGALFAVGRLLRALDWGPGSLQAPTDLDLATAPAYPIRGHQLGNRPKSDTYDAWDLGQYVRYVRDLIAFGNNAVEIIPSIAPDDVEGRTALMPMDPWDMMIAFSTVLGVYDMDVWFWLPLGDVRAVQTPGSPERQRTLQQRADLFAACPRIDNVFVPGGDPGNTPPQALMPFLKELAAVLHEHHPKARLWVSTQGFEIENLNYFYEYLQKEQPDWLAGVVYGPWTKDTMEHTRQAVPARYSIRNYPDITHTVRNQYPVPEWDDSWFQAYERQPIMPSPARMQHICTLLSQYTDGAVCYSDGIGDDVNKIVWDAMLWDPKADLEDVLREYGRYFIGPGYADGIAEGLLMLEQDWVGPALTNPQIPRTLAHWQALEKRATPEALGNWRFQQGLIRAYADAYVQQRLQREIPLLNQAYAELKNASKVGPDAAIAAAERILEPTVRPVAAAPDLHSRILELADALNKSTGMQLSIAKQHAARVDRGALLDSIDRPISDASWLLNQVSEKPVWLVTSGGVGPVRLRDLKTKKEKMAAIKAMLNWENPGPGGFYDDLGDGAHNRQPHLVTEPGWEKDPGYVLCPQDEHGGADFPQIARQAWYTQAQTLYETPLRMRYTGLDPKGHYAFKVAYTGRFSATSQLYLDGRKIGKPIKADRYSPGLHEVPVPQSAVADGALDVMWKRIQGRGVQIAEAWLIKK